MTSKTVVQYTPEQTEQIVSAYTSGQPIEQIALMVGKSTRSVIAKLSREGAYVAKAKTSAASRVTKAMLVAAIAAKIGASEEAIESLEKATHEALELVANAL
jgi:hypothetical protein